MGVTSLERLTHSRSAQRPQPLGPTGRGPWAEQEIGALMQQLKAAVVQSFGEVFNREMRTTDLDSLEDTLAAQQAAAS